MELKEEIQQFILKYLEIEFDIVYDYFIDSLDDDEKEVLSRLSSKDELVDFIEDWYCHRRKIRKKKFVNLYI